MRGMGYNQPKYSWDCERCGKKNVLWKGPPPSGWIKCKHCGLVEETRPGADDDESVEREGLGDPYYS